MDFEEFKEEGMDLEDISAEEIDFGKFCDNGVDLLQGVL